MAFPALQYPSDYASYKQQYMDMLNLQISNDKKNYDAVSLQARTGQLPITPTDYRSIDEKYADVLGLQRKLTVELGLLTDATNLGQIMNDLQKNPPLMNFILMSMPAISEYMKKNYARGVKYPVFISYVEKLYEETNEKIGTRLLERVVPLNVAVTQEQLNMLKTEVESSAMSKFNQLNIVRIIEKLIPIMFTRDDIDKIKAGTMTLTNTMLEAYKKMPSPAVLQNIKAISVDEADYSQKIFNVLDDAYLAISTERSGNVFYKQSPASLMIGAPPVLSAPKALAPAPVKKTMAEILAEQRAGLTPVAQPVTQAQLAVISKDPGEINTFIRTQIKNKTNLENFLKANKLKKDFNTQMDLDNIDAKEFRKNTNGTSDRVFDKIIELYQADPREYTLTTVASTKVAVAQPATPQPPLVIPNSPIQKSSGKGLGDITQSRFDILKGEVLAGNNSRPLINELKRLIHKMVDNKSLDYNNAMLAIDDLNNM